MKKFVAAILLGSMLTVALSLTTGQDMDQASFEREPPIIIQNGVTTAS